MSRSIGRAGAAAAILILIAARPLDSRPGQSPQNPQQPVFRGGANFVNVDAYPRRDGRLVEGLTAADFQIFEDGKPQRIESFEFIKIETNVPDADRRDPNTQRDAERLLNDPRRRAFVVYLDEYHISRWGARELLGPLREFLQRVIAPSDLFAVMLPDTPLPSLVFGQRLEVVERALEQFRQRMMFDGSDAAFRTPRTPHEQWLHSCYINRTTSFEKNEAFIARLIDLLHTDIVFSSLEELSARLAALRNERTNVLLFSSGWPVGDPVESTSWTWGTEGALPQIGVTRGGRITTSPTQPDTQDRTKCDGEMLRLTQMDFPRRFERLVDVARRSNVSYTAIDPGGLATPIDAAATRTMTRDPSTERADLRNVVAGRIDALRTLATNTDGAAIVNTNDIRTPLRRFADDVGAYYLLGYYSTNTKHDGRFRRIDVKVTKPDVKVAARSGYVALTPALAKAVDSAPSPRTGTTAVEDALGALGRARPDAEVFTYGVARPDHLAVVVELPNTQAAQKKWAAGADIQITLAGATDVTARGRIEPSARATLIRVPRDTAGPWKLAIRLGGGVDRVEDHLEVGAPPDGPLGQPVLFRGRPPAQSPVLPAADLQFLRAERLHVEWPVSGPLDRREARVLGRNGQPLALTIPVTERQQDSQTVLVVDFALAPLAAGDYVLELTTARESRSDRSLVAFRVGR